MGLDGGTIITRSDVLRGSSWELSQADDSHSTRGGNVRKAKKQKLDPKAEKRIKWSSCSLSGEPLCAPIVADYLGNLYNKSAVLEFLLAKSGIFSDDSSAHRYINQLRAVGMDNLDHLKSIKDVFTVHICGQKEKKDGSSRADEGDIDVAHYHCPVTDMRCDRAVFVALTTCGHCFSERAVTDMKQYELKCVLCNECFTEHDIIVINPTEEQKAELERLLPLRKPAKRAKQKKNKT